MGEPAEHRDAAVVGGGLAGITTALRLADAGRRVTLIESRPRLGGAAFSFVRAVAGADLSIDNGQHVFLRCCSAYRSLLDRLDAADRVHLQPRLDIPVLRADGRAGRLRRTPGVPAPLHLSRSLAGYPLLSLLDRARAARGALALKSLDPDDASLDDETLGAFLRRHGQSRAVVDALWGIVATATLNLPPEEASLQLAATVFRTGLLDTADAGDVGWAAAPLGDLHHSAALRALQAAGVEVLLGAAARRVEPGAVTVAPRRSGAAPFTLAARDVVLAVPHHAVRGLADVPVARLGSSAIVNVHVVYDRHVTDLPFGAAVGTTTQWFFDRTSSSGLAAAHPDWQYLAVTISAADALLDVPSPQLQQRVIGELARLLPGAARAEVRESFVTRERRATFRQAPGSGALRPGPETAQPGVWLAGAWTATGWPDTMESAVRSGHAAADAVLAHDPGRIPEREGVPV
jgi:squalene-associated FAD-dependent desaturase